MLKILIFFFCFNIYANSYDFSILKNKTKTPIKPKSIKIFFYSALWCESCQKITPSIIQFYTKYHKKHNFDVILVSLDFTEEQFWTHIDVDKINFNYVKFKFLKTSHVYSYAGVYMPWITIFNENDEKIASMILNKKTLRMIELFLNKRMKYEK